MAKGLDDTGKGKGKGGKKGDAVSGTRNGYDPERLFAAIKDIEEVDELLVSERGKYMSACKKLRDQSANIFEHAKRVDNIPTKELKVLLKDREYDRKKEANRAKLDIPERANYSEMVEKLGEFGSTGLGAAALKAAKAAEKANGGSAPEDVRPRHLRGQEGVDEAARIAEENKAALEGSAGAEGIKPLSDKKSRKRFDGDGKPLN